MILICLGERQKEHENQGALDTENESDGRGMSAYIHYSLQRGEAHQVVAQPR